MKKILKERYPRTVKLKGRSLTIRPLGLTDEQPLAEFFLKIPVDERRMFKDDVTDIRVIRTWCRSVDFEKILPLVVFSGERIVGDATLHRERAVWNSHVARMRMVIAPDFRGIGLGHTLVREFMELARPLNVALLDAEVMTEQREAIKLFENLDFVAVATLPQHVRDLNGQPHDLVVFSYEVFPPAKLAVDKDTKIEEVDVGGGA